MSNGADAGQGDRGDPICDISVECLGGDRYRLTWDETVTAAPVTVRAAPMAEVPGDAEPVAEGARGGADVTVPGGAPRWYFRLETAAGAPLVVAERGVTLEGGVNFRDLGGYAAADGGRLRWGRLFRSGHLAHLTEADREVVASLGISTVCDYRHPNELARENAELPNAPDVNVIGIPPGIGNWRMLHELFARTTDPEDTAAAMHDLMVYLVRDAAHYYQGLFDALLEGAPGAFLMNCSGGKERSGVGAALTLSALGVPRTTILYDYMLSSRYTPIEREVPNVLEKYEVDLPFDQGRALILPLLETRPSYLSAAFDTIEADHGSVETFLRERYGVDEAARERLRELYLSD